jgi:hypothetical protein
MNIISIHLGRPLDKRGVTVSGCLARSTIVAALGGLLFGFDTAVIAGVTHALRETYWTADCSIRSTRRANTIRGESRAGWNSGCVVLQWRWSRYWPAPHPSGRAESGVNGWMSPPLNQTGFRRDTTATAHRPGSRQSNGSADPAGCRPLVKNHRIRVEP